MDLKKTLQILGYTKNEATVYLALLKLGLTQAGPIIKATKLHGMLVYSALEKLTDYGLVTEVRKKNIKHFQALDPVRLLDAIKQREETAEKLIPELQQLQVAGIPDVSVKTLVGREGLMNNLKDIVQSAAASKDHCIHIIGGAKDVDFYEAIGDHYGEYLFNVKKYGVSKKMLAPASYSTLFRQKYVKEQKTEMRTLPKGLNTPAYTRITEDLVSIEIYKPEIVVIQMRSPIIAKGYLDSFELLWSMGK